MLKLTGRLPERHPMLGDLLQYCELRTSVILEDYTETKSSKTGSWKR